MEDKIPIRPQEKCMWCTSRWHLPFIQILLCTRRSMVISYIYPHCLCSYLNLWFRSYSCFNKLIYHLSKKYVKIRHRLKIIKLFFIHYLLFVLRCLSVIPRKTEFSLNCMSPTPQPNIEKNVISIQRFLFLNSDVTLWCVKW